MKGPSLPVTAFFSFLLHLTFIFTAVIAIKNANHFTLPSAYIVSLVSTEVSGESRTARGKEETASQIEEPEQKMKLPSEPSKNKALEDAKQYSSDRIAAIEATRKAKRVVKLRNMVSIKGADKQGKDTNEDSKQYSSDRIAAIEATRKAKRVVKLRDMVSIEGADKQGKDTKEISPSAKGSANEAAVLEGYSEKIGEEIEQHWAFPEAWGKDLQAIISVTIMSNGAIKINKIEKSSGNALFDRSVLRAINKASPVSPPPHEMELGLNFQPRDKK